DRGDDRTELDDPFDDGKSAVAAGATVRQCPPQLLFEREEEAGGERERREPECGDRGELFLAAERGGADLEEGVGGDARDEQGEADRERALREGGAAQRGLGGRGHGDPRLPAQLALRWEGTSGLAAGCQATVSTSLRTREVTCSVTERR